MIYTMNIDNQKFRVWRRKNNLTQSQVAEILGVSYRTITNWECKGFPEKRNQPSVEMAKDLVSGKVDWR